MADVTVSPTPIQRNDRDVAMELLTHHINRTAVDVEEISGIYAQYYALANTLSKKGVSDLKEFLPEEVKNKFY